MDIYIHIQNYICTNYITEMSVGYHNTIKLEISYGAYCWCSNDDQISIPDYYLTQGAIGQHMLTINIRMDPKLTKKTDIIQVIDHDGMTTNYYVTRNTSNHHLFFPICEAQINTVLQVKYYQICGQLCGLFTGRSQRPLHADVLTVPRLVINDPQECTICLDPVDPIDQYVTTCHHIFHAACIWKYLETTHLVLPKAQTCHDLRCQHGPKVRSFYCPNCRHLLETLNP